MHLAVICAFLKAEGREQDYIPLSSDPDAVYDKVIDINLDELRANPYQPRKVFNDEALNDLAESIRKRQPWVLWEGGEEQERQSPHSVLNELIDSFRKRLNL